MIDLGTAKKLLEEKGNRTFTIIGNFIFYVRYSTLHGSLNHGRKRIWAGSGYMVSWSYIL